MTKANLIAFFSTIIGMVVLIGSFYFFVINFVEKTEQHMVIIFGCLFLIPTSLYYWNGRGRATLGVSSVTQWLGMFVVNFVLTLISFLVDCAFEFVFHSGIFSFGAATHRVGFVITLAGVVLTMVAGGGVIRALIVKLATYLTKRFDTSAFKV